jgi:O-succinylbenzoate synthase
MGAFNFTFSCYQKRFKRPLQTTHGIWKVRRGIIVHLEDEDGRTGQGEIAPLEWFGSENMTHALTFCQQLKGTIDQEQIHSIGHDLPATRFAFESALKMLERNFKVPGVGHDYNLSFSYLLPAGPSAWSCLREGLAHDHHCFKWKMGVFTLQEELAIAKQLLAELPPTAKLRLDPNGALTLKDTKQWLKFLDRYEQIDFFEQPLPPAELATMVKLQDDYRTPLALDESVSTLIRLQYCLDEGWRGVFVLKPAIAGSPQRLKSLYNRHQLDVVFSSVFETEVGRSAILRLGEELKLTRPVGFGLDYWLN